MRRLGSNPIRKRAVESSNSQDTPDRGFLNRTQHRQTLLLEPLEILQHLGFGTFFCPGRGLPVDLDVSRTVTGDGDEKEKTESAR